ncbi:peptidyl-prolyl cis-trans isomerase [Tothia fuscella]|uniref:peptidylprolyl isomerase n=1 Tax=Tothia fuscella TaxID=1048955 RepID=A0A9P4TUG8_9PEZI|nr:peptidyl-prolyl cis-trans isomerase [Tothia fuscella]
MPHKKGSETPFDTSVGRGEFDTKIGIGRVIRGWDEGIVTMSLGEKATLVISSDYAYGSRGFPQLIPPNATLVL